MRENRPKGGQAVVEYAWVLALIVTVIMLASLTYMQQRTTNTLGQVENTLPY